MGHVSAVCLQFGSDLCSKVVAAKKGADEKPSRGGVASKGQVTSPHISNTQVRMQPRHKQARSLLP